MRHALSAAATFAIEEVAEAVRGEVLGRAGVPCAGVSIDSRTIARGELFFAIAGPRFDGHAFLAEAAARGAAVVIAGKGHEAYQVLRDRTVPFDDRQVARDILNRLAVRGGKRPAPWERPPPRTWRPPSSPPKAPSSRRRAT